jgi:hypothetical protein
MLEVTRADPHDLNEVAHRAELELEALDLLRNFLRHTKTAICAGADLHRLELSALEVLQLLFGVRVTRPAQPGLEPLFVLARRSGFAGCPAR